MNVAQRNNFPCDGSSLRESVFRHRVRYAGVIEKPACEREDTVSDACEMGVDDKVVVSKAAVYLVDKIDRGWGFYRHYGHYWRRSVDIGLWMRW